MFKNLGITAAATALAVGMLFTGQPNALAATVDHKIPATNGKEMFAHYCTPCHGADGKGRGPVVMEQRVPPIDLTVLTKNHHGKFPESYVNHVLQFGANVPSHTSVEMPVWGPILGKINQKDPKDGPLRISSLRQYLETIQAK
jgi:hypothetical protein